jgi:PTS system nitrogen regulatory IIA component
VLTGLVTLDRIQCGIVISSKKRLLEELSILLAEHSATLDKDTVFRVLTERERLGSTGIGAGIALPHGRLNGISECVAAVIRLKQPLDFDALDQQPISLAVALLVPADASGKHLQILANLAHLFNDIDQRNKILHAGDAGTLLKMFT